MAEPVSIELNGRVRKLRFTKRTAFRAGRCNDLLASGGAVALSAMVWCLLDEPNPKETPEDIWDLIDDDDVESVAEAVQKAWEEGNRASPGKPKKKRRSSPSNSD